MDYDRNVTPPTSRSRFVRILVETWDRFSEHGDLLAASIAFFTLLSFAPLVVIALSLASIWVDRAYLRSVLVGRLSDVASADIADFVVRLTDAAEQESSGLGTIIAAVVLLWAASRLFIQVQDALNMIWGVRSVPFVSARDAVQRLLVKRLISFAMVMGCGALLLSMLIVQALLSTVGHIVGRAVGLPSALPTAVSDPVLFFALLFTVFAALYRILPDVRILWRDVVIGALFTATLVIAGTLLLGVYLTRIAPSWLQGAAGALAAFMVWVYYLAQVFLLGASFTRAWSCSAGHAIEPEEHAQLAPELAPTSGAGAS